MTLEIVQKSFVQVLRDHVRAEARLWANVHTVEAVTLIAEAVKAVAIGDVARCAECTAEAALHTAKAKAFRAIERGAS